MHDRFISLEPEDRRRELARVGATNRLDVLIETGTNEGRTPLALRDRFQEIYTIELHDGLWERAELMFRNIPNVHTLHGDSTHVLPEVLAQIDSPALVWLDGHYSGPGTGHGAESSPIKEELKILFEDGRPHFILIDDARIFLGGPEHELYEHYLTYPSLDWVRDYAAEYGYSYELRNDIIYLEPPS